MLPEVPVPSTLPTLQQLLRAGSCDIRYTADLVASAHEAADRSDVVIAGNSVCGVPQNIISACLSVGYVLFPSPGVYSMNLLGTKANLMYDLDFTHCVLPIFTSPGLS